MSPHNTTLQTAESGSAAIKIRPTRGRCTSSEARRGGRGYGMRRCRCSVSSSLPPACHRSARPFPSRFYRGSSDDEPDSHPSLPDAERVPPLPSLSLPRTLDAVHVCTICVIYGMSRNFSFSLRRLSAKFLGISPRR